MASLHMTPAVMLGFSLSALGWLVILAMFGWAWGVRGRRAWMAVPVSLVQGVLGAQVLTGVWLMGFNQWFPETFLAWLAPAARLLFNVALFPAAVGQRVWPSPDLDIFAAIPFYALAYLALNGVLLLATRRPARSSAVA